MKKVKLLLFIYTICYSITLLASDFQYRTLKLHSNEKPCFILDRTQNTRAGDSFAFRHIDCEVRTYNFEKKKTSTEACNYYVISQCLKHDFEHALGCAHQCKECPMNVYYEAGKGEVKAKAFLIDDLLIALNNDDTAQTVRNYLGDQYGKLNHIFIPSQPLRCWQRVQVNGVDFNPVNKTLTTSCFSPETGKMLTVMVSKQRVNDSNDENTQCFSIYAHQEASYFLKPPSSEGPDSQVEKTLISLPPGRHYYMLGDSLIECVECGYHSSITAESNERLRHTFRSLAMAKKACEVYFMGSFSIKYDL